MGYMILVGAALLLGALSILFCIRYRKNKKYPISEEELETYMSDADRLHEAKVRRWWMISYSVVSVMALFSALFPDSLVQQSPFLSETGQKIVTTVISVFYTLVSIWIGYHCAYKKKGTIWLLLVLLATPVSIFLSIITEWGLLFAEFGWWVMLSVAPVLGMLCWFWVNCLRLRRVNLFRQSRIQRARDDKYFQKTPTISSGE